jgi:hypothetical protein
MCYANDDCGVIDLAIDTIQLEVFLVNCMSCDDGDVWRGVASDPRSFTKEVAKMKMKMKV